jgi:hypothetical protein
MTHRTVGFGRGFPRTWLLPIAALTVLLGVAASGRLSRAIVADLIAWWPVWVGLAIAGFLLRNRKIGSVRVSGLVPLVALFFVGLFTWGHLAGWSIMPSASQRLVGSEVNGITSASLTGSIDGRIDVAGGADFLYVVEPIMRGGGIGIPTASELLVDSTTEVVLEEPSDPGLYSFAGWEITLSNAPVWDLILDGALEADLTGLAISTAAFEGSGTVVLGDTLGETPVSLQGSFRVVVPTGVPARVVGVASVPATWVRDEEGASAPVSGGGWVLTVVGDTTLTVTER